MKWSVLNLHRVFKLQIKEFKGKDKTTIHINPKEIFDFRYLEMCLSMIEIILFGEQVNFNKQQKLAGKKPSSLNSSGGSQNQAMLVKVLSKSTASRQHASTLDVGGQGDSSESSSNDGKSDLQRLKEDITASTQSLETLAAKQVSKN